MRVLNTRYTKIGTSFIISPLGTSREKKYINLKNYRNQIKQGFKSEFSSYPNKYFSFKFRKISECSVQKEESVDPDLEQKLNKLNLQGYAIPRFGSNFQL